MDPSAPTPPSAPTQVEAIYAAYPRKQGKVDALRAIEKALRNVSFVDLLARTRAYAIATAAWNDADRNFIPYPATWFNRGSYDDDPRTWVRSYTNPKQTRTPTAEDHERGFLHGTEFEAQEKRA